MARSAKRWCCRLVPVVLAAGVLSVLTCLLWKGADWFPVPTGSRRLVDRDRDEAARERAKKAGRELVLRVGKASPEQKKSAVNVRRKRAEKARRGKAASRGGTEREDSFPDREFSPGEQEVLDAADEAVSEQDLELAAAVAKEALASDDPRIREQAVETLMTFGEAGLPELADFLKDPHPAVARLAADRWELGVQEVENEEEQVALAKLGMFSVRDEDELRAMAGTLTMASDSYLVIAALADVIRDGSAEQAAAAKEAYESVTCEPWMGVPAANKWLEENYDPPESEATESAK